MLILSLSLLSHILNFEINFIRNAQKILADVDYIIYDGRKYSGTDIKTW